MKKIQKKISKQYFLIKLILFVSLFIWIFNPFLSSKFSWWLFKYKTNKTKIKPTDVFLAYLLLLLILFQTLSRLNLDIFSRVNLKNVTKQLPNGHNTHIKLPTILIRLTKRHTSTVYDVYLRLPFQVDKILFQVKKKIKKKVCQLRTIDCESMIMQQIEIFGFCLNWRTFLRRVMSYWSCGLAKNQAWTNDS